MVGTPNIQQNDLWTEAATRIIVAAYEWNRAGEGFERIATTRLLSYVRSLKRIEERQPAMRRLNYIASPRLVPWIPEMENLIIEARRVFEFLPEPLNAERHIESSDPRFRAFFDIARAMSAELSNLLGK